MSCVSPSLLRGGIVRRPAGQLLFKPRTASITRTAVGVGLDLHDNLLAYS